MNIIVPGYPNPELEQKFDLEHYLKQCENQSIEFKAIMRLKHQ